MSEIESKNTKHYLVERSVRGVQTFLVEAESKKEAREIVDNELGEAVHFECTFYSKAAKVVEDKAKP